MPRIVKQISTQTLIYHQQPEFKPGMGVKNAARLFNISPSDLEEVEVSEVELKAEKDKIKSKDWKDEWNKADTTEKKLSVLGKMLNLE